MANYKRKAISQSITRGGNWNPANSWYNNTDIQTNRYKTEAYSLADGVNEQAWSAVILYSPPQSPVAGLQAPVAPFSVTLQVTVGNLGILDIKPPNSSTPPSPDPPTVEPPQACWAVEGHRSRGEG